MTAESTIYCKVSLIPMKLPTVAVLGIVLSTGAAASAQPSSQPSDSVVLIRVFATVSAEVDEFRKRVEQSDVQVATGTGFIVSPLGHILTNHHLIHPESKTVTIDGRKFEIKTALDRIEVVLPSGQRLDATVFGSDPEVDLAVLAAGAGGLPYLPFGDSDAIERGASVTAFGYPLGEAVEVGRRTTGVAAPQATITPGAVSAVRAGDDEQPRFLQVTNALNPGNSGGPIVDAEGYAVGIVAMKATKADGVGFAIAINRAKDFLERVGLDSALPSRRLALGPAASLSDKGLRLRMPHGYQDLVPGRLRVEAGDRSAGDPVVEVDRVFSRWTLDQMERGVLAGAQVVSGPPYDIDAQARRATKGQVSGRASRTGVDGGRRTMEYRIVSLGSDWIVARYEGTAEAMAFNRSVLKASLESIEVDPLLRAEVQPPQVVARARRAGRVDCGAGRSVRLRAKPGASGIRLDVPGSLRVYRPLCDLGCRRRLDARRGLSRGQTGWELSTVREPCRGQLRVLRAVAAGRNWRRADRVPRAARARSRRGRVAASVAHCADRKMKSVVSVSFAFLALLAPELPSASPDAEWPSFRGPSASGVADGERIPDTWDVARRKEHPMENSAPRARAFEPGRRRRSCFRDDGGEQQGRRDVQARALRRRDSLRGPLVASMEGDRPGPSDGQGSLGARRLRRGTPREAPHQGHVCQSDSRHRRTRGRRVLRVAGTVCLRRPGRSSGRATSAV